MDKALLYLYSTIASLHKLLLACLSLEAHCKTVAAEFFFSLATFLAFLAAPTLFLAC